jgi:Na+-translocating ferredoxin:NAD+ oxidoreductase RnfG subunit
MEVITLYTYRTPDGYSGSIVQVRKKDENETGKKISL